MVLKLAAAAAATTFGALKWCPCPSFHTPTTAVEGGDGDPHGEMYNEHLLAAIESPTGRMHLFSMHHTDGGAPLHAAPLLTARAVS